MTDSQKRKSIWRKWLPEPQMMVALAAGLISLCALFVSIYETSLMREQQKANVWPHLEISHDNVENLLLNLHNRGVGPARIEAVLITVDKKPVHNWQEAMKLLAPDINPTDWVDSWFNGRVIPQGGSVTFFNVKDEQKGVALARQLPRIGITICYSSIYDDFFTAEYGGSPAAIPSDCSCDPKDQFQFIPNGRTW